MVIFFKKFYIYLSITVDTNILLAPGIQLRDHPVVSYPSDTIQIIILLCSLCCTF